MKKSRVAVLMSTYNGEKYLDTQIETILNQKNVDVYLFIRDDGSNDNTRQILKNYETNDKINVVYENNIGYAKSFWNLLKRISGFDYYAFCDQDDIWLDNKLSSAVKMIEENSENDEPVLYTSKVISINNAKEILNYNTFDNHDKLNVYQSFQKSKFPGCVFVFNKSARDIIVQYNGYLESHDWASYNIISVFGKTIFDNNSYIHYRIHEMNAIGKTTKYAELKKKIKRFINKSKCTRSNFAYDFYNTYKDVIPKKYKDDIYQLAYYKNRIGVKLKLLFNRNFKGVIFKLYVLMNKI